MFIGKPNIDTIPNRMTFSVLTDVRFNQHLHKFTPVFSKPVAANGIANGASSLL